MIMYLQFLTHFNTVILPVLDFWIHFMISRRTFDFVWLLNARRYSGSCFSIYLSLILANRARKAKKWGSVLKKRYTQTCRWYIFFKNYINDLQLKGGNITYMSINGSCSPTVIVFLSLSHKMTISLKKISKIAFFLDIPNDTRVNRS